MIRNKKAIIILISILFATGISVIIAYAALQKTLTVSMSKINQNAMTWDVGFRPGEISSMKKYSSDQNICKTVTATKTSITGIDVRMFDVGDRCQYYFHMENNGTVPAKISNITITKPSGISCTTTESTMVCGNITYRLFYQEGNDVAVGDIINPNSSRYVKLFIEYTGTTEAADDFEQNGFGYYIDFVQG